MATFSVDIHGVRMSELQVTARSSPKGAYWITLEFAGRDSVTFFLATETDFREMVAKFNVEPRLASDPVL